MTGYKELGLTLIIHLKWFYYLYINQLLKWHIFTMYTYQGWKHLKVVEIGISIKYEYKIYVIQQRIYIENFILNDSRIESAS